MNGDRAGFINFSSEFNRLFISFSRFTILFVASQFFHCSVTCLMVVGIVRYIVQRLGFLLI